jgi:hypothetical protein
MGKMIRSLGGYKKGRINNLTPEDIGSIRALLEISSIKEYGFSPENRIIAKHLGKKISKNVEYFD